MAISPSVGGPNVLSTVPAASFFQDGRGFAAGDMFDAGGLKGTWMFCVAAATVSAGNAVSINNAGSASLLTKALADTGSRVGVAPVAVTSGDYFWAQLSGVVDNLLVKASCAADVALYTSATAGYLDDDSTSQTKALGIKLTTARAASDGVAPALIFNAGCNTQP